MKHGCMHTIQKQSFVANGICSLTIEGGAGEVKTKLIAFFDINRLLHHESITRGQSVNLEWCKQTLL